MYSKEGTDLTGWSLVKNIKQAGLRGWGPMVRAALGNSATILG